MNHVTPLLQTISYHHQHRTPMEQLTPEDQSRMNLFRLLYGSGPPPDQALDRIESGLPTIPNVRQWIANQILLGMRSNILTALTSDWYAVSFWCGDSEWILDEEYRKIQNKPKQCTSRRSIRSSRGKLYKSNSNEQGWSSIRNDIFLLLLLSFSFLFKPILHHLHAIFCLNT